MHVRLLKQFGAAFLETSFAFRLVLAVAITIAMLAVTALVYYTGGVQFSFLHLMYVPVVLAGFVFGVPGGILASIAGGLLLGPCMPLDVETGAMQPTHNWIYRIAFFLFIGVLVGTFAQVVRRHLRELQWLHDHHEDTGLLNMIGLNKELDARLRSAGEGHRLFVSITQLDDFLEIQNTFGTGFGMRVLSQVVERVRKVLPEGSLIALIQPDRIATAVDSEHATQVTRERTEAAVKDSFLVDGVPVHVEASIGVAHFPAHGRTAEELLQKASIAMHRSTTSKSAITVYDPANDRTSRDNLVLLGTLPAAIENGELQVWHQAKVALATDKVAGTEALVRWKHPQRGMVPPGNFIPQCEETTLINPVTQFVIAEAFRHAGTWRAGGHQLRVSVNLSVRNLRDRMLLEVLEQNMQRNGLEPKDIDLEVTESAVMADPDYCIRLIAQLGNRGFGISIDDFGVGHSSLAYLQKLQVSCLKIDQTFIRMLRTNESDQKIVRSILHMAEALGLDTVAEGVEDLETASLLREWGCDYGQGYGFHRPSPSDEFLRFLVQRGG